MTGKMVVVIVTGRQLPRSVTVGSGVWVVVVAVHATATAAVVVPAAVVATVATIRRMQGDSVTAVVVALVPAQVPQPHRSLEPFEIRSVVQDPDNHA